MRLCGHGADRNEPYLVAERHQYGRAGRQLHDRADAPGQSDADAKPGQGDPAIHGRKARPLQGAGAGRRLPQHARRGGTRAVGRLTASHRAAPSDAPPVRAGRPRSSGATIASAGEVRPERAHRRDLGRARSRPLGHASPSPVRGPSTAATEAVARRRAGERDAIAPSPVLAPDPARLSGAQPALPSITRGADADGPPSRGAPMKALPLAARTTSAPSSALAPCCWPVLPKGDRWTVRGCSSRCCSCRRSLRSSRSTCRCAQGASTMSVSSAVDSRRCCCSGRRNDLVAAASACQPVHVPHQENEPHSSHAFQHGLPGRHRSGRGRRLQARRSPGTWHEWQVAKPLVGAATTYFAVNTLPSPRHRAVVKQPLLEGAGTRTSSGARRAISSARRGRRRGLDRRSTATQWVAAAAASAPLYLTYYTYKVYLGRVDDERRQSRRWPTCIWPRSKRWRWRSTRRIRPRSSTSAGWLGLASKLATADSESAESERTPPQTF